MKRISKLTAVIIMVVITATGCTDLELVRASNNISTQSHYIEDYNGVEIASAIDADITYTNTDEGITIEANDNLHQYLIVDKSNGNLRIKLRRGVNVKGRYTIKAHISTGNLLDQFSASGASNIVVDGLTTADYVGISLSGASRFNGAVSAQDLSVHLSGASNANVSGESQIFDGVLSGASTLNSYDLVVDEADIGLSGASQASLTVNGSMDVVASGASVVRYRGNGSSHHIELSGGSQLIKMD